MQPSKSFSLSLNFDFGYFMNDLLLNSRQWEQVSFLANEAKNFQLTFEAIEKAADLMMLDGTRDSAGIILEKAAG